MVYSLYISMILEEVCSLTEMKNSDEIFQMIFGEIYILHMPFTHITY